MLFFLALRIWLSHLCPITYTNNGFFDDFQLLKAADLDQYFQTVTWTTLNKTLSFPWFLHLVSMIPFSLDTTLVLVWFGAAWLCWKMIRTAGIRKEWALFGFVFVLFCPCAFDNRTGIQLYRNILLAPCGFGFIELCSILFLLCWKKNIRVFSIGFYSLLLALLFPFAFYLKEDGLWMLLVLLFFEVCSLLGLLVQLIRKKRRRLKSFVQFFLAGLLLFSPLINYEVQRHRYIQTNEKYYDYSGITLRTDGSFYEFIQNIYKIESPDRNILYWAPRDAYRKAMSASPTLAAQEPFNTHVLNSWLAVTGDISGDFLGWVMLTAMHDTDTYTSPSQIESLFKTINQELDTAFENGTLVKDTRFQLTSQAGGRTFKEILALFPDIVRIYISVLFVKGYYSTVKLPDTGGADGIFTQEETEELLKKWSVLLKTDLEKPEESLEDQWIQSRIPGTIVSNLIFWIYRIINPLLFGIAFISWIDALMNALRQRKFINRTSCISFWLIFFLVGISFVYATALVWFCQFLLIQSGPEEEWTWFVYYDGALWGILFSALLLFPALFGKQKEKYKNNNRKTRFN